MIITEEMLELIEDSFTHELLDALEVEADADVKEAITNELKKRGIDNV